MTLTESGAEVTTPADESFVDCDVHNEFRNFTQDLLPFLEEKFRHYITNGGFHGVAMHPYAAWMGVDRHETTMPDGTRGSARYDVMKEQHLDAWDVRAAILTGPAHGLALNYLAQQEFASALASAANDYLADKWLGQDARLHGSIVVAAQDPVASAREIDRMGEHPEVVQLMLPMRSPGYVPWSDEKFHPIWEAVTRNNLAVGFHVSPIAGNVAPPTTAGWPRSYMELSSSYTIPPQAELVGMVCRGLFELFPSLRVAIVENGFGWLPSLMWRLDKRWKELRAEVPWLKRRPSEYIRERVRFTTQPMEEPDNPQHLLQMMDMLGSDDILMFATDYPHWDFDSPTRSLPRAIDPNLKRKILRDNATEFYQLGSR